MSNLATRFSALMSGHGSRVTEGTHLFRAYAESALTGGALGYAAATMKNGLDAPIPNSTKTAPIDGAVAALAALGVLFADGSLSSDMRNVGATALGILSYRKGKELTLQHASGGVKAKALGAHGESAMGVEDPIVALGRTL